MDNEKMKILIVDDQPNMRWGISRIMRLAGYDTLEAESGSECIGIARNVKPDMILLDVVLGDSDGKEVCRTLKADPETAGIPILLVSGLMTDLDSQADGMEYGADGCISKPIHNRELLARVKAILRIRESERRLAEALAQVKRLSGLLPICSSCKKIRDDLGYWKQIEVYIREHSDADFTHSICPDCARRLYPEYYKE